MQNSKFKIQKCSSKLKGLKTFAFLLAILTFNFSLLTFNLQQVNAATSSNDNYNLEIEEIDQPSPKKLTPIISQNPTSKNLLNAPTENPDGIKNINLYPALTFSVSENQINFGLLTSGNPVKRKLSLSLNGTRGYEILAYEDQSLANNNRTIPDTTCDSGSCTRMQDAIWKSNLTYGFGYNCINLIGSDCLGFETADHFKALANLSKDERPASILSGILESDKSAQIILKVNQSGTGKPASYSNTVTFIAVPNY